MKRNLAWALAALASGLVALAIIAALTSEGAL